MRECNAVHSEMAEELRKQKEASRRKESELHSVIKELQIQIEEIETERKRLERELSVSIKQQSDEKCSKVKPPEDINHNVAKAENEDHYEDYLSDRDLRRLAYKLKKDQWLHLAKHLSLTESDIKEIGQLKISKDEKAFRVLSEWRTQSEEVSGNQVSQLALALEEIRRKDLAQFVMEHCMSGKCRNKLIGM